MAPLFSDAGRRRLDDIVRPGMLCVFDFDGTLAPIVTQPDEVRLPPNVLQRLIELSGRTQIAILTGRSVVDIAPRLEFKVDYLVGNHGLEGVPGWQARSDAYAAMCRNWKDTLTMALTDPQYGPGIFLEDKHYSLSVHYRQARDQVEAEARLKTLLAGLQPPARIVAGKCVFSLMPQDGADKGSALEELMRISGASGAIYVGDDVTDEDVFRLNRDDLLSVRVEHASDSNAEFFVHGHQEIEQLLDELIERLRKHQGNASSRSE
ncbi:MAG: trehalose-phosphatase [Burkholderiales bacterium RIFCSPLOWO2_02_FULL_57_36]|nr:MAG: trehalose-phosphatase [Burkholderiales bacterium RIFCSPLOWO2_02_FULL_57_36]